MSWLNLNQSLNSLKGQITSFASEVLSEAPAEESQVIPSTNHEELNVLQEKCCQQELEIVSLKQLTDELQASLQSERLARKNGVKEDEAIWNWDHQSPSVSENSKTDPEIAFRYQIQALNDEISALKESNREITKLREDNKNLTMSLEDLDNQHQMAMEKLLTLKKELQKNFEVLKQEHEDLKNTNDEYSAEIKVLKNKIEDQNKELEVVTTLRSDLNTLRHKYQNLERIHGILKESTEKFQEENQELHEETFKLQEQVTKLEHEIEVTSKNFELSDMVPRERYEDLLKELNDIRISEKRTHRLLSDESNIDDNAKGVIENLKREISDLKHKLAQKELEEPNTLDPKFVKTDTILYLYDQYVNFELPVDYIWNIPSAGDNTVMYKLEGAFKTLHEFKKDIDALEHAISEKSMNEKRLQEQIDELTTDNDVLSSDVNTYYSELSEMKKNNDFLLSELTTMKNTSKLEPIIETHEDNLVKLESELADSNRMNVSFQTKIDAIEKELSEVQKEKIILEESLADLREKYNVMLQELDHCKIQTRQIEELQNNVCVNYDPTTLVKANEEIDLLKKHLLTANTRSEQLAIDLSITENDKILLAKQIHELNNDVRQKSAALVEMEQRTKDLERKINEAEETKIINKNLGLIHTLDLLENEKNLEELKSLENDKNNTLIERITTENNELQSKLISLAEEIAVVRDREQKLLREMDMLTNNNTENTTELQKTVEKLKYKIAQQESVQMELLTLKENNSELEQAKRRLLDDISVNELIIQGLKEDYEKVENELKAKELEIKALNVVMTENKTQTSNLKSKCIELENAVISRDACIKGLNETVQNLKEAGVSVSQCNVEYEKLLKEKNAMETKLLEKENDLSEKENKLTDINKKVLELEMAANQYPTLLEVKEKKIQELSVSLKETAEKLQLAENNFTTQINALKEQIETLESVQGENRTLMEKADSEKQELINLINLKHHENIQYHNEIQRLNQTLYETTTEYKSLIEERNRLLNTESGKLCTNCDNLKLALEQKDQANTVLNEKCVHLDKINHELIEAKDAVILLKSKCDELETDRQAQLEIVKNLKSENIRLSEQEHNSTKELERLRHHLLEQEENHTQELMVTEQKLQECLSRLHQVEERHKQSSTVYTSNSIRANQEVETIRSQMRLIEKQRDEIQLRLSEAEDQNNRSNVALTNLQLVLEQFQRDKDRDIETATVKLQNKMTDLKNENERLCREIDKLNVKLTESIAGLQAATRLGDQLETKTAQINDLKEQVRALQSSVQVAEEKYVGAVSNQQDRVDKNLVKNLLLNYVQTSNQSNHNRSQVLRVLSTVLDFNRKECEQLGLVKPQNTQDSLATEFVRFLEKESRPAPALPPMQTLSSAPSSRKTSVSGTPQPVDHQKHTRNTSTGSQNVLFQSIDSIETQSAEIGPVAPLRPVPMQNTMLESGVNQMRNNEGAILKQVLKDT